MKLSERCVADVPARGTNRFHRCKRRKAGGLDFCGIHDPQYREGRRLAGIALRTRKYSAGARVAKNYRKNYDLMLAALYKICKNPRGAAGIASEALARVYRLAERT